MPDYRKQILKWFDELQKYHRLNQSAVSHLMSLCRQLLESNDLKKQYAHLNLYCNWTLHSEIDRSKLANEILDRLSIEFASTVPKQYNDIILEIIGLHRLRNELIDLFRRFSLPTSIFESKSAWKVFVEVFGNLLVDKPLTRDSEIVIPVPNKPDTYAVSLRLSTPEADAEIANAHTGPMAAWATEKSLFWIVRTNKLVTITGLFAIPESDSAFTKR